MSKQSELNSYIVRVQERLRLGAWLRGAAIFAGTALVVTVGLVLLLNRFAFPEHGITGARLALVLALGCAAAFGLALPLMRLTRERAVRRAEAANPELEQRLTTFHDAERKGEHPFLELLAADTLAVTEHAEPRSLVADNRLFALGGAGLACLLVLIWMIAAGPGYLGYGASLLWTGPPKDAHPFYSIAVRPGNVVVRRNSDQLITAQVMGMQPSKVELFAHYQSAGRWEPVAMQAQPNAGDNATYQFVLAGLPENVEYYVAAGPLVSSHYTVRVVDLPSVKNISVTYRYPKWTGMKPVTEEHSGDLRAIEGTDAAIELEMDRPLKNGQLTLDDGQPIQLAGGSGNKYQATVHMGKDGAYHVAALDEGQPVRLSEDYFIATDKAQPPEISVARPSGDYRANPIEEVTVGVKAADQFGLNDVHLHYSVNGAPERTISLLDRPGAKNADGTHVLPLEDFKLEPGDVVSVYASARDGHAEARTDISFIQVEPFEREFSQSQQGGGGGGGGGGQNNQTEISKREKELIAATWKQQNDKTATAKDAAVAGQFLSEAQQKLRDQVMALSARIESRDLSAATEEFTGFDKDMQLAAEAMAPSADKLKATQWKDALPLEQKALQALLRAEATFRKIEVAFGQNGGGGGGGGNAGRDLASLFDLELDTEKNQYETAQNASPAEKHQKDVEDALAKLDALAKRQEEQANQRNPEQSFEQRWQQEMLRREAEELKRQMEELAKNGQQGQQGSSASGGSASGQGNPQQQKSSGQAGSQGQAGSESSAQAAQNHADPRVQQALRRLEEAADAMKKSSGAQPNPDAARQAAEQLRQAANLMAGTQQQLASGKVDSLANEAGRLSEQERAQAEQIDKLATRPQTSGPTDLNDTMARMRERDRLAQQRQQLSDDLSKLQKNIRDSAREMAPNQPEVARQLRDALTEMDNADLDNHTQRTADWLRRGVNPNSNGTEAQIAQGLERLKEQLQQAQRAMGQQPGEQRGPGRGAGQEADQTAALDSIERLRNQIESMNRANGRNPGSGQGSGQDQQNGQHGGQQPGNGNGRSSESLQRAQGGQGDPQAGRGAGGQAGSQQAGNAAGQRGGGLSRSGDVGGPAGDTRNGDPRGADGTVWGNVNTGNNQYGRGAARPQADDPSGNYADTEKTFQQGMRELNQLRQMVKGDPQAAKEAEELARQMQHLDPSRFPGNPAIVEHMHQEVLSSIDRLELAVERSGAATLASRTGKPQAVPEGYQDSVAEYYRQLSKSQ
jgi:hypothetical protein